MYDYDYTTKSYFTQVPYSNNVYKSMVCTIIKHVDDIVGGIRSLSTGNRAKSINNSAKLN